MVATPLVEQLNWKQARNDVKTVNKELASIIDKISPDKNYSLFKISYSFGDLLVKEGVFQLPQEKSRMSPVAASNLDNTIKDKLSYSPIPLFLTLKNCHEVFFDINDKVIPLNLFSPGSLLGLFESMDFLFNQLSHPRWSVSAGARSLFMLPKITEAQGLARLYKQYGLDAASTQLIHLTDHWSIFKSIATHPAFTQPWQTEILVFSKEWFNHNDSDWIDFRYYLFKYAWQQSRFAISKIELSLIWENFLKKAALRRLKLTPYLSNQVKHIISIASGQSPGFRPTDSSQQTAPCKGLQETFLNIYMLKNYFPTLMHSQSFNFTSELPVYYSLMLPTLLEGSSKKNSSTIIEELQNIYLLLTLLLDNISHHTIMNTEFKNIIFKCFHIECGHHETIHSSRLIPEQDAGFLLEKNNSPNKVFCATSSFWCGAIQVMNKIPIPIPIPSSQAAL